MLTPPQIQAGHLRPSLTRSRLSLSPLTPRDIGSEHAILVCNIRTSRLLNLDGHRHRSLALLLPRTMSDGVRSVRTQLSSRMLVLSSVPPCRMNGVLRKLMFYTVNTGIVTRSVDECSYILSCGHSHIILACAPL